MRCVFGIGNPGNRYKYNRHNVGFMLVDYFSEKYSLSFVPSKGDFYYAEGEINNSKFILIKPSTYVNNSGIAASQAINDFNIDLSDFLVIVDDLNLETAKIRLRRSGKDGGHNGVASIIYHLNSNQFPRLRIGIGSSFNKGEMASYVLDNLSSTEKKKLEYSFVTSCVLLKEFIIGGTKKMFDANSKIKSDNLNKD